VRWHGPLVGVALLVVVTAIPAAAVVFLATSANHPANPAAAPSNARTSATPAPHSASAAARGPALRAGAVRDAAPARISGTIRGGQDDGTPLGGVRVTAYDAVTGAVSGGPVTTSSSGTYRFPVPGAASYIVCADAAGASAGGFASACSQPVAAPDGGSRGVDLPLPASAPTGPCRPGDFTDVDSGNPFCPDITWLVGAGVTQGADAWHFDPAGTVTRGQMALFLYRLQHPDAAAPTCDSPPFPDVPVGALACGPIAWLVKAGVTNGAGDGSRFDPTGTVTRGQMALFLDRMHGPDAAADHTCTAPPFPDVPSSGTTCGAVFRLVQTGVTAGTADGEFAPGDPVTRGQMAAFLHRLANPTRITGTVTAGRGAGVPGVSVIVTGMGDTHQAYSTVTRIGGVYTVPIVAAGTYQVCFDASAVTADTGAPDGGYAFQCFDGVPAAGIPNPVAVPEGSATTVDAVLAPPSA
jgi:hypothetical protein